MYFYPFMLNSAHNDVVSTACQELAHVWINRIDRQNRLRMDTISDLCRTQLDNFQSLVESNGGSPYIPSLLSCIAPKSSHLTELAVRSGEIAADTQRQVVELLGRFAKEVTVQFAGSEVSPGDSRTEVVRDAATVRRKKRAV